MPESHGTKHVRCPSCGQRLLEERAPDGVFYYAVARNGYVRRVPIETCPRCGADLLEAFSSERPRKVLREDVLTTSQVRELLGVSKSRLFDLIDHARPNRLPMRKAIYIPGQGPRMVISRDEFIAWARREIERPHPGPQTLKLRLSKASRRLQRDEI